MNKNFDKEYKDLAQNDAPDLWNRIEAGITKRPTPKSFGMVIRKHAGLLTAAICLIVIIPAIMLMGRSGLTKGAAFVNESAADEDVAAAEAYDTGVAAAEAAEEEPEMAAAPQAVPELAGGAAAPQAEMAADAGGPMNDTEETLIKEAENKDVMKQQIAENSRQSAAEDISSFEITVKVTSVQTNDKTDVESAGMIYTAVIEKEDTGAIEKGSEVSIFAPIVSDVALIEGETYTVIVRHDSSREIPLELISLLEDENN